jgi:hypothetical protein
LRRWLPDFWTELRDSAPDVLVLEDETTLYSVGIVAIRRRAVCTPRAHLRLGTSTLLARVRTVSHCPCERASSIAVTSCSARGCSACTANDIVLAWVSELGRGQGKLVVQLFTNAYAPMLTLCCNQALAPMAGEDRKQIPGVRSAAKWSRGGSNP